MRASIIITNYNYARFLPDAIESALGQTFRNCEVICVDDGSTDESRFVIDQYRSRLTAVFKENGGQASAFNSGFELSSGDFVVFLDADDILASRAVEQAASLFEDSGVSKVHWKLYVVDASGKIQRQIPEEALPSGDLREKVIREGPSSTTSPPTSGNAWSRNFLNAVMPIPESLDYFKVCADEYLFNLAPLFGVIRSVEEPLGYYRIHGNNIYSSKTFKERLEFEVKGYDQQCVAMRGILDALGEESQVTNWKKNSWFLRLRNAVDDIVETVPAGEDLILIDSQAWGTKEISGRRCIPFLERNGEYWGPPTDSLSAIDELNRQARSGVRYIVLAWNCFWWMDHYGEFWNFIASKASCLVDNDAVVIYKLGI